MFGIQEYPDAQLLPPLPSEQREHPFSLLQLNDNDHPKDNPTPVPVPYRRPDRRESASKRERREGGGERGEERRKRRGEIGRRREKRRERREKREERREGRGERREGRGERRKRRGERRKKSEERGEGRGEERGERGEGRGERRGESNDNRDTKATRLELPCEPFAETDGESLSRKEKKRLANSVSIERKVFTPRRCTARQRAQSANCRAWKIKIPQSGVLTCMGSKMAYLDD